MNSLRHFPLGEPFPDSPHAVISSLPTMADVRGYEEHDPRVLNALKSGYPRFVVHEYVQELIHYYLKKYDLGHRIAVLIVGRAAVDDVRSWVDIDLKSVDVGDGLFLVHGSAQQSATERPLRKYVQHTGCGVSSRQAEDRLLEAGLLKVRFEETVYAGESLLEAKRLLAEQIGCDATDLGVCSSGMSAFYAGFRSVQALQRPRGRTVWMQLGWLYLDSGCVLKGFLEEGDTLEHCYDVFDVDEIIERIRAHGKSLAAVVVECPSNPLIRVCELHRIAEAVRSVGGVMIVDPTVASVYNVDVLPCADVLVTSLTKYASIEGDIMIGAWAVNSKSPDASELRVGAESHTVAPYRRDLARFAHELQAAPSVITQMNENTKRLCAFLMQHPAVKQVYCAGCSDHVAEVAKSEGAAGSVLTIELNGSMEAFYDAVRVMKGPSFGARFTLLCPFMYLAHYNLVTEPQGRAFLSEVGIDPELIRISVGAEDYSELEAVFTEALEGSLV